MSTIQNDYAPVNYADKNTLMQMLGEAVLNGENPDYVHRHRENIRNLLGKHRVFE
jgi:hypothetical protein